MMRWMSTRTYVSIGLCGVTVSVMLVLAYFGFIPDRIAAVREGRTALAEVTAAASTALITANDVRGLDATLQLMIERNRDLLSVGIRRDDGTLVAKAGEHEPWRIQAGDHSTEDRVKVPILSGSRRWGQVELRFGELETHGMRGVLAHPWTRLVCALALLGFFAFQLYLGRVLRQLDPSQAVPARVRAALDSLVEGLIVIDRHEHVVLANSAFAAVVGETADALIGRSVSELAWTSADGRRFERERSPWRQVLRDGQARTDVMIKFDSAQGGARSFIVNCAPVLGSGRRPGGVLISLDDVTQMERTQAELARAKDDAESASRAKSEFLANMSHEIRTPMNAILGFTELLRRGQGRSEADLRKHLATIHSSGKHLLDLINDILDLSKVEAGRFDMERERCAAHRTVGEVLQVLAARANEKGLVLAFEIDGAVPQTIESDPGRLRQIVTNLVGNAIKFTQRGRVEVRMRLLDGIAPKLEIAVQDSGIGIDPGKLGAIFEPFTQADASVSRRFGGTGLGLAISRRFARALGGDIVATSHPGAGSTFIVTIATGALDDVRLIEADEALATPQIADEAAATHGRWTFPRARVLVVDDGPENRELVRLVLSEVGLDIDEAENGRVGVERVSAQRYDVVLMDIQMPELDGLSATRELRRRGCSTPIVALTAHAMKGYEQEIRAAGCSDWLVKPIDIDGLIAMLARILGGKQLGDDLAAAVVPVVDRPALVAAGGPIVSRFADKPRLHAAVRLFATRLEGQVAAMEAARSADRFDELASLAHALKGAGGTVGFSEFTEPAIKLEEAAQRHDAEAVARSFDAIRDIAARIVVPEEPAAGAGRAAA